MSCKDVFETICGADVSGWTAEARVDCAGRIWGSSIVRNSPVMVALANGKTYSTSYHFWSFTGKTATASNIGVPNKDENCPSDNRVGQKAMTARKFIRTSRWSQDFLDDHCNQAPESEAEIIRQIISDWSIDLVEMELLQMVRGVYLDNVANDGSDLVYDASDAATNHLPNYLTKDAVIEGSKVLGCKRGDLGGMLVHEDVMLSLEKRDLITVVQTDCDNQDGKCIERTFFANKEIFAVDDDQLTVNGDGTGGYLTVLFREGAFAFGGGDLGDRALGIDEDECKDGGMGSVSYIPRDVFALHPIGWDNTYDPAANGDKPNAGPVQNALPATWCRVNEVQNVGMVFIAHTEAP